MNTTEINPEAQYVVIDRQTGSIVYTTTYKNRKAARRFADRKDNAYGAYRFSPELLRALQVMVLTPEIKHHLFATDPKALEQAERAIAAATGIEVQS